MSGLSPEATVLYEERGRHSGVALDFRLIPGEVVGV